MWRLIGVSAGKHSGEQVVGKRLAVQLFAEDVWIASSEEGHACSSSTSARKGASVAYRPVGDCCVSN